jgi:uncharacterized protein with GYD domain
VAAGSERSIDMPTFVVLVNWTDEGARNVKDTVQRANQVRADFQRRGITRFDILWTQGRYDILAIADAPDEQTMMAALLALATRGTVRTETLRAFSEQEMEQILQKIV